MKIFMKRYLQTTALGIVILLFFAGIAFPAPKKPATPAELALYSGSDRQQILEEGAKKEGNLTFYTTGILQQAVRPVVDLFQKKYPFIKVNIWRSTAVHQRIIEEYRAGSYLCDVSESAQLHQMMLQKEGVLQPFSSPNLAYILEDALTKASGPGVLRAGFRESGIGLGYNTKLINKGQLPKTYQELLDPRWFGKMGIPGSDTGRWWVGTMLAAFGEDFVKQIAKQKFDVHMVSGAALLDMVINGEYAFSPAVFDSHVTNSKQKGAPVDWIPLEPVHINLGEIVLIKNAPHLHAALLFSDLELSRESGEIHKAAGYSPTRRDVPGATTYKKYYGAKSLEESVRWGEVFDRYFLKK